MIIDNKQAKHNYEILEKIECGIVLTGNEIKSIRKGSVNLKGSFCRFIKKELFVFEMYISKYEHSNTFQTINETKDRKLLLHKKQLIKLEQKIKEQGLTIIPLKLYFNDKNKCKIEIGICKGKKNYDKRNDLKEKSMKRKIDQELKDK